MKKILVSLLLFYSMTAAAVTDCNNMALWSMRGFNYRIEPYDIGVVDVLQGNRPDVYHYVQLGMHSWSEREAWFAGMNYCREQQIKNGELREKGE